MANDYEINEQIENTKPRSRTRVKRVDNKIRKKENNFIIDVKNLVIPPPISREEIEIDPYDLNEAIMPGNIRLDKTGKLLKSFLDYKGFAKPLIDVFDHWIKNNMLDQLQSFPIKIGDQGEIQCINVGVERPKETPMQCRREKIDYSGNVVARYQLQRYPLEKYKPIPIANQIIIGKIPIMIGSEFSHYNDFPTAEAREQIGECPADHGGYFIISGIERVVMIGEKLRTDRIFTYIEREVLQTRMICQLISGTSLIVIKTMKDSSAGLFLPFMGKKDHNQTLANGINVFHAMKILGLRLNNITKSNLYSEAETMIQSILVFTKQTKEARARVTLEISSSILGYIHVDPYAELRKMLYGSKTWDNRDREEIDDKLFSHLFNTLFPQVNEGENYIPGIKYSSDEKMILALVGKIEMLSMMLAQYYECKAGIRPLDDRDSWANKRVDTAGKMMEQLFLSAIKRKLIIEVGKKLPKEWTENLAGEVLTSFNTADGIIKGIFHDSFAKNWGISGGIGKMKEGTEITTPIDTLNLAARLAHTKRINPKASRQSKSESIRTVQSSQYYYVDPADTPESAQCGLTKNCALTTVFSYDQPKKLIIDQVIGYKTRKGEYIPKDPIIGLPYYSRHPDIEHPVKFVVNGLFHGWCSLSTKDYLIGLRRKMLIPIYTAIVLDDDNYLNVYTDSGRILRPLLVVNSETERPVIEEKNLWGQSFSDLLSEGAVEYIDAYENEYILVAYDISYLDYVRDEYDKIQQDLQNAKADLDMLLQDRGYDLSIMNNKKVYDELVEKDEIIKKAQKEVDTIQDVVRRARGRTKYTHCELHPSALMGISASIAPLPEHNQSARTTFQCKMARQALGFPGTNYNWRMDTTLKTLSFPTQPLFVPMMNQLMGLDKLPTGNTITVALMSYHGYNQEDAFIVNKGAIDRGLWRTVKYTVIKVELKSIGNLEPKFERPVVRERSEQVKYENLDENGIIKVGSQVNVDDIISYATYYIGKERAGAKANITRVGIGEDGIVEQVIKPNSNELIIKIYNVRKAEIGDKTAPRHSQKGTISTFLSEDNMPVIATGPDAGKRITLIANPHSIPSRMTMSFIFEFIATKIASLTGEAVDATAFKRFNINDFTRVMNYYGFSSTGYERVLDPQTGKLMPCLVYVGPTYYQLLHHQAADKIQSRDRGGYNLSTGQPFQGKSNIGGLRIGGMERNAFISHGASSVILDRLMYCSDAFETFVCATCGQEAVYDEETQKLGCRSCGNDNIKKTVNPKVSQLFNNYMRAIGIQISSKYVNKR